LPVAGTVQAKGGAEEPKKPSAKKKAG